MIINNDLDNLSKKLRKKILYMALHGGSSAAHLGGALSIVEILSVLIKKHIKLIPGDETNDHLILSKGHACLAYYAALIELGFIDEKEMETFEKDGSNLMGHPIKNLDSGIEFSTGSLGMGLSIASGLCLANKKLGNKKKNLCNNW
jgi:transketolase